MLNKPNVVFRGGCADGQIWHHPDLGEPISLEDVGGRSVTYEDSDELKEHDGIQLRVYVPRA